MTRTRAAAVTTAVALVTLLVSVVVVWSRPGPGASAQPAAPAPSSGQVEAPGPAEASATKAAGAGAVVRRSAAVMRARPAAALPAPVRLALPAVDVDLPVRPVGVAGDRQMELPADPSVLGWYRYGPAPGADAGSSVIAGHLDSTTYGLGPLVRLREVRVGDRVEVALADGSAVGYTVSRVDRYDRERLPADLFARVGPALLRLVTCGGAYDAAAGGYQQNLVITAAPD